MSADALTLDAADVRDAHEWEREDSAEWAGRYRCAAERRAGLAPEDARADD